MEPTSTSNNNNNDSIKTFLRIKTPLNKDKPYFKLNSEKNFISLYDPISKLNTKSSSFEINKIFTDDTENSYIYEEVCLNTIKESLEGISYSFISYGETTTNKQQTLFCNINNSINNINNRGIFPRVLENLLKKAEKNYEINLSYFMIFDKFLIDLSLLYNKKNFDLSEDYLLSKKIIIKDNTDIIDDLKQIKTEKTEDSLLFLSNILKLLINLEKNSANHIFSRSHICTVVYITKNKQQISNISFILLNGSEILYSTKAKKFEEKYQKENYDEYNSKSNVLEGTKIALETQYTYESILNGIKNVFCADLIKQTYSLKKNADIKDPIEKTQKKFLSNLTTVLYKICFSGSIKKIKFRIIADVIPYTGLFNNIKDTLHFLLDCNMITKKKFSKKDFDDLNLKNYADQKKDDIIFDLESTIKKQKIENTKLNKRLDKDKEKILFLEQTYEKQIDALKNKFNFPGSIEVLMSGNENTAEAKFVKEMKERANLIKIKEGNIYILKKQLESANEEINRLKNREMIKKADETMINYYFASKKSNEAKERENKTLNSLFAQIENLKKEIDTKNKINESLKKEIENKNNILFNLPASLKDSIIKENEDILKKNISLKNYNNNETKSDYESLNNCELKEQKEKYSDLYQNFCSIDKKNSNLEKENSELKKVLTENKEINEKYKIENKSLINELLKINELLMDLISNYHRIFYSKLSTKCSIITLKNKKEEFDNIILNIDKNINYFSFPLLFKELELQNKLHLNIPNTIANIRRTLSKQKKAIEEDAKKSSSLNYNSQMPPPPIDEIKKTMKKEFKEVKINKERLESMSKDAIIENYIKLNKKIFEMEKYLEKYTNYKKGFNVEEFENSVKYNEDIINNLTVKNNKLTNDLNQQIDIVHNNKILIDSQNRIISRLQKDQLERNIIRNRPLSKNNSNTFYIDNSAITYQRKNSSYNKLKILRNGMYSPPAHNDVLAKTIKRNFEKSDNNNRKISFIENECLKNYIKKSNSSVYNKLIKNYADKVSGINKEERKLNIIAKDMRPCSSVKRVKSPSQ